MLMLLLLLVESGFQKELIQVHLRFPSAFYVCHLVDMRRGRGFLVAGQRNRGRRKRSPAYPRGNSGR